MNTTNFRRTIFFALSVFALGSCSSNNDEDTENNDASIPEEESVTNLFAELPVADKEYLGSGYDVTGTYLGNDCLRECVIDLSKLEPDEIFFYSYPSGYGDVVSGIGNSWECLDGLRESQEFDQLGESGDVYFAGTFTNNPLFKEEKERGNEYAFMMYMDRQALYIKKFNFPLELARHADRFLSDEFKKAVTEESAQRIVERFGTHVLEKTFMGVNILSIYRTGLQENKEDPERFLGSMFRRMSEVYHPFFSYIKDEKATKGGVISVQCHGNNTQALSAEFSNQPLTREESSKVISDWWNASSDSNLSLALLDGDDLIPIYKLISDETKRAEVQRAVKAYIHSHQLQ